MDSRKQSIPVPNRSGALLFIMFLISCGSEVEQPTEPDVHALTDHNEAIDQNIPIDEGITDPGPPASIDPGEAPDLPSLPDQIRDESPILNDTLPDRYNPPAQEEDATGTGCQIPDGCPFDDDDCLEGSAVVEILALDIWGQPLKNPSIELFTSEGVEVTLYGNQSKVSWLCGPMDFNLTVEAPDHETLTTSIQYDGQGNSEAMSFDAPENKVAIWATTEIYDSGDGPIRYYTLWVGLPHLWFAPTGYPARHGNLVDFLIDGEEAWHLAYADMQLAQELVAISTWWWDSNFELFRHPTNHTYQSTNERYWNTIMGTLDYLDYLDVPSKVLVNQFWSQDGFLSDLTVDANLLERAENGNDLIEYMGAANQIWGSYTLDFDSVDFKDTIIKKWVLSDDYESLPDYGLAPFYPPYTIDMSEVPLGLGAIDFPHASWHQKSIIIDQNLAYVGGMNFTKEYWDTTEHKVFESRRMNYDATTEEKLEVKAKLAQPDNVPWKDYFARVQGPVVHDVMRVFDWRWWYQQYIGAEYSDKSTMIDELKAPSDPLEGGVQAQVVTTMPPPFYENSLMETLLRAIAQAEDYIFIEDQYFRAPILGDAIREQMLEKPALKLIVITNKVSELTDPGCWPTHLEFALFAPFGESRFQVFQLKSFDWADTGCFFCIDESQGYFEPIYIHSKLVIIDDKYLQTGSANHNNRGLLYEGEMALVVFDEPWVSTEKDRVLETMLGSLYEPGLSGTGMMNAFSNIAWWNELTYDAWELEGFDLNLNGNDPSWLYETDGFVYNYNYGTPSDCFFSGIGPDMM